jgi:hypothetical protein
MVLRFVARCVGRAQHVERRDDVPMQTLEQLDRIHRGLLSRKPHLILGTYAAARRDGRVALADFRMAASMQAG